ncbi:MAG: NAD-dependent succinate-semialdehyde dehydrogenase, partial [Gammaproteobacteria bacterium]|nr:NAD-dependent succinate-semialdehyde dehydrogenase [Gammaproteobacteria bacterium]
GTLAEDVINPANEEVIGELPHASAADLDDALIAAQRGYITWRSTPASERAGLLARCADLVAARAQSIAHNVTLEQGKPLAESRLEVDRVVETFRWFAAEATRVYGRLYPPRVGGVRQMVQPEPLGVAVALTAWNFPAALPARKLAPALAAGCSVILKAAEETPGTAVALVQALADAGLPPGVVNLVFGVPADISAHLLASPIVRKLSFTGSVPVGKSLARLAADNLIRCTLELGGHAPAIVFDDAVLDAAVNATAAFKFRNAGQVCITPSRFYVHESTYPRFVDKFTAIASGLRVGDGLDEATQMGPMANSRRVDAMERLIDDARARGATIHTGGARHGNRGFFWQPTTVTDIPDDALLMTEEPFGPVAPIVTFRDVDEVVERANSLRYGLAAYLFTQSQATANHMSTALESGSIGVNTLLPAQADTPMGGVKDSGYGYEGGHEGLDEFLVSKLISRDQLTD